MPAHFGARTGFQLGNWQFYPFLNPFSSRIPKFRQTRSLIMRMGTQSMSKKRPTCPSCSKPARICLCNRLQAPILLNSVAVTVLQHSLEKRHPLNSTRIAAIGLKNVDVVTVWDVNSQAWFFITLLDSSYRMDRIKLDENSQPFDEMLSEVENRESGVRRSGSDGQTIEKSAFNSAERRQICQDSATLSGKTTFLAEKGLNSVLESGCGEVAFGSCTSDEATSNEKTEVKVAREFMKTWVDKKEVELTSLKATAVNFTTGKCGAISSVCRCWIAPDKYQEMSFDQLLASDIAGDLSRKGFVVKKLKTKVVEGSNEYEESEEFEVAVPPGSVLLFPSETSVDVETVNLEVKNLIVLDGTWAKAKRMYNENPWLRLLPHIRLGVDKLSLYSEVRHQPRAGYLSTIESIVYAMKAVGEECQGLDGLLDVFESMVGDQRRCKNERLSKFSEN